MTTSPRFLGLKQRYLGIRRGMGVGPSGRETLPVMFFGGFGGRTLRRGGVSQVLDSAGFRVRVDDGIRTRDIQIHNLPRDHGFTSLEVCSTNILGRRADFASPIKVRREAAKTGGSP